MPPRSDQELKAAAAAPRRRLLAYPTQFDWRPQGVVPAVRDQGSCGSCWAFAGVAALEVKAAIDGVAPGADMSEQQIVDCANSAPGYRSFGCNGGYSDDVLMWASNNWVGPEASYKYTALTGTCATPAGTAAVAGALKMATYPGSVRITSSADALMDAVANQGAVIT